MILAERAFSADDQLQFAAASGDYNPMHMDALQARRTQAGAPVVHGINLLLWALDLFAAAQSELPRLKDFRVHFSKFVYLNEPVKVEMTRHGRDRARLSITVDGSTRSKISLNFGDSAENVSASLTAPLETLFVSQKPLNLSFEKMKDLSGKLPFCMSAEDAVARFPAATRWLGGGSIAALAASTHLVGMVCPGLHSIYSELEINICPQNTSQDFLAFQVTEADERFHSVEQIIAGGGLTGVVKGFVRTPPVEQATMASLSGVVAPTEFAGSVALIVGGSRGLGELTAKLIATGGGKVIITWKSGKADADRVAQEIRMAGGKCEAIAYDAGKSAADQLSLLTETPTHAYYFATPAIFRPQSAIFSQERFDEFLAVYVNGFWALVKALQARQPGLSVFYPSSVSITERPAGMTEYSMAKAAGEVLCADINTSMAPLHVTVSRLPRLPTDQTASVAQVETAMPIDILLPLIRNFKSRSPTA
jgi:hypothetical protein